MIDTGSTETMEPQFSRKEAAASQQETKVLYTADGAPYVICRSKKTFVNPTTKQCDGHNITPEEVNQQLNLNLGQNLITRNNKVLLWAIKLLDAMFFRWWESVFFYVYGEIVPLSWKRRIIFAAWRWYLATHTALLGKRTGLHPSQSFEYHALTTLAWWSRFFVISPGRIRFSLSQLYAFAPCDPPDKHRIEKVHWQLVLEDAVLPVEQQSHAIVTGWYFHTKSKTTTRKRPRKVILWFYGGAYLGGDIRGNSSTADWFGEQCDMDIFIPYIRLAPEADLDDVLWDASIAYRLSLIHI